MKFTSVADLLALAAADNQCLSELIWQWESEESERSRGAVWQDMEQCLLVMEDAIQHGIRQQRLTASGMAGTDAVKLMQADSFIGPVVSKAAAYAVAVSEINAGMGRIVACPTAGSCGIVPGAMFAVRDAVQCPREQLVRALFTAGGIGHIIATKATISGAVGGCQAECGAAAAMAAAAVVEMLGGTAVQAAHAVALALKNMLGLVCDPVAGLVEVPCIKRNGFAAVHALTSAHMALAGVESVIPADEVIEAMLHIGLDMPRSLKETSEGGLAKTPTGLQIAKKLAQV